MENSKAKISLFQVMADTKQHGMVRHEAAEALGNILETEEDRERLKIYENDEDLIVRESVEVALDINDYKMGDEFEYC